MKKMCSINSGLQDIRMDINDILCQLYSLTRFYGIYLPKGHGQETNGDDSVCPKNSKKNLLKCQCGCSNYLLDRDNSEYYECVNSVPDDESCEVGLHCRKN